MTDAPTPDPYAAPTIVPAPTTPPPGYEPPPGYVLTPVEVVPRSPRLGLVAMCVAIFVVVATIVVSFIVGVGAAPFAVQSAGGFRYNLEVGSSNPTESALAVAGLVQGFAGTALGIWALIQGIVAVATRRGRRFGVVAIVLAALGPLVTGLVTLISVATHLPH
jgi:hypothetical protein